MLSHRVRTKTAALMAIAVCALGGSRQAVAQPSVAKLLPASVMPGKTTEMRLEGAKLDGVVGVWTSFPARVEVVGGKEKGGKNAGCKVTLSPNVPVGIGGIVVATAEGASEVVYVMVDDLPIVADGGKNHAALEAQEVALPVAIEGESDGTLADYFRFKLRGGEQISVEVVAARLGQDFDALVRVLDEAGNELVIADDDAASGADARFVFTAPKDGKYVLELRDNRYKPGGQYRLRLGKFPLVSVTLPPVVELDAVTEIQFRGPMASSTTSIAAAAMGDSESGGAINVGVQPVGSEGSGWAAPVITQLPVVVESRSGKSEAKLSLPCIACGVLETSGERDRLGFQGVKGKALRFKAITRSAGSPAIVALRVLDSAGKQAAESPVTESDEPVLAFTPPADGAYTLAVDELAGRFGSDFVYAVECQFGPQFTLTLKNDKNNRLKYATPSGGAFYLDVQCQRAGYDGPIALAVDSSRSGWQLINAVIPAKVNEVRMYVQPPVDFAASELATLRIVGKGEQSGHVMTASMSSLIQLRAVRPQLPYPPRWQDGLVFVSGQPVKPGFYNVAAKSSAVELPRSVGEALVTLDFERIDAKFKDTPLVVVPVGLPAGVTAEVKRNGNGPKETYDIRLKSGKDVAAGQHRLRYFAYAELAGEGRGMMSGDVVINVVEKAGEPAAEKK